MYSLVFSVNPHPSFLHASQISVTTFYPFTIYFLKQSHVWKKNSISTSHFPPEPFKITSLCPLCLHILGVFSFQGRYYPSGPWCSHQNEEVGAEASLTLVLMVSIQNLLHLILLSLCFSSVRHSSVFDCISLWYTHLGTFSQTGL